MRRQVTPEQKQQYLAEVETWKQRRREWLALCPDIPEPDLRGTECSFALCRRTGQYVHKYVSHKTGQTVLAWCYCPEHVYPRYPNILHARIREADGSLVTFVTVEGGT